MDKSPLMTLTLEDFLETQRHSLIGVALTPVTLETFTKWKKERMDKKAAEAELKKAKDASGRALFEKGGWQEDSEEESEDEVDDLDMLRQQTEADKDLQEQNRINGVSSGTTNMETVEEEPPDSDPVDELEEGVQQTSITT
jgi:hypothetical protein